MLFFPLRCSHDHSWQRALVAPAGQRLQRARRVQSKLRTSPGGLGCCRHERGKEGYSPCKPTQSVSTPSTGKLRGSWGVRGCHQGTGGEEGGAPPANPSERCRVSALEVARVWLSGGERDPLASSGHRQRGRAELDRGAEHGTESPRRGCRRHLGQLPVPERERAPKAKLLKPFVALPSKRFRWNARAIRHSFRVT